MFFTRYEGSGAGIMSVPSSHRNCSSQRAERARHGPGMACHDFKNAPMRIPERRFRIRAGRAEHDSLLKKQTTVQHSRQSEFLISCVHYLSAIPLSMQIRRSSAAFARLATQRTSGRMQIITSLARLRQWHSVRHGQAGANILGIIFSLAVFRP
jgi:hypothetical protein